MRHDDSRYGKISKQMSPEDHLKYLKSAADVLQMVDTRQLLDGNLDREISAVKKMIEFCEYNLKGE